MSKFCAAVRECHSWIISPFLFALEERQLYSGFYCLGQRSSWCPAMSSGKVASESSLCPWVLGPTFLGDPEVVLEKNSDVRLRSERTGGWEWMFLKEKQLSFSIRDLAEAATVVLLLPSRAWTCPIAATQSRGIGGTREAGEGMGSGSGVLGLSSYPAARNSCCLKSDMMGVFTP